MTKHAYLRMLFSAILLGLVLFQGFGCAGPKPGKVQDQDLDRLRTEAADARNRIQKETGQSTDPELKASLKALDTILDYVESVRADPDRFDPDRIGEYNEKIRIVRINIDQFKNNALQTTITFSEGSYEMSELAESEQEKIRQLAADILETAHDLHRRFPKYPLRITLKILGYSDEARIARGSRLEAVILKEISEPEPPGQARRQQFNRVLSGLRAAGADRVLTEQIRKGLPADFPVGFSRKITGMGEELPGEETGPKPYAALDPRRRISRISAFVEIVL